MPWGSFLSNSKAHEGAKSQNKHPSWIYYTVVGLSEAASGGFLLKRLLLKISQYPQEKPELEPLFKKVTGLKACNFIKKRPQHRFFPMNIEKFLGIAAFWLF